ncbi:unnamed protein product, partial [Prorocentrum cordatum]
GAPGAPGASRVGRKIGGTLGQGHLWQPRIPRAGVAAEEVQGMSSMMAGDFKGDLAALESEHSVEVHQADTLLWIAGKNAQNVTTAKRLLQEMLEFYMPEGFHLRKGLSKQEVEALCQDPGMICRTSADPEVRQASTT